jgi:DNA-directed RNA polymerase subunit RPC12/RpoP
MTVYPLILEEEEMALPEDTWIKCPKCGRAVRAGELSHGYIAQTEDSPAESWDECPYCGHYDGFILPSLQFLEEWLGEDSVLDLIRDGYMYRYGRKS